MMDIDCMMKERNCFEAVLCQDSMCSNLEHRFDGLFDTQYYI